MNVKALWELWHYGDMKRRIGLFRQIRKGDLMTNSDKTNLIRARKVMASLFEFAVMVGGVLGNASQLSLVEKSRTVSQTIFGAGYNHFIQLMIVYFPSTCVGRRWDELQYTTLYQDVLNLLEHLDFEI